MSKKLDLMTAWATMQRARGKHISPVVDEPEEALELLRLEDDDSDLLDLDVDEPTPEPVDRVASIVKKLGIK